MISDLAKLTVVSSLVIGPEESGGDCRDGELV